MNDSIEFSNQDGGGTGEVAGQKWLVEDAGGDKLASGTKILGFIVLAADGQEGWVQVRDNDTVNDTQKPLFTINTVATGSSKEFIIPDGGYMIRKGLYLRKPNDSIVYVLIA
jgi:hypothetical protein